MKLLIDIGNTALKWAYARNGALVGHGTAVHGGAPAATLAALPAASVDAAWIAHVTGVTQEPALADAIQTRFGCMPQFARSTAQWQGLQNRYREPERLGVDRWLAMIAAWHEQHSAACIIDAGTALTADAIAGDGAHLGGYIAAGLATQQRAILGATRFATRDVDTTAYRAAALAGPDARLLIGGGDAAALLPHLPPRWTHRPLLVLEGLLALASHAR